MLVNTYLIKILIDASFIKILVDVSFIKNISRYWSYKGY